MPDAQTQQQPQAQPAPQPATNPTQALGQGLGTSPLNFGDVMKQISPFVGSGAPIGLVQQESDLQGKVLQEQQKQKISQAQTEDDAYSKYGATAKQALDSYQAEMADSPLPAFVPTKETASDIGMLGGMLAIIGFMVGKGKGMQPGLAALDSMTGMLRGWQQGRRDLYDRELSTFKSNFDRLRAAHQEYAQQLQNALGVAKVDLTKGLADAQLAAAKAGDSVVAAQAKAGNLKAIIDAMNGQQAAMTKAAEIASKLYTTEAQNIPLDPTTMEYWAQRIRAGDPMPALGFGGMQIRKQLLSKVAQDAVKTGSTGTVDQALSQIRRANQTSLSQVKKVRAMVENYEKTALKSSYLVQSLAGKGVGPSGSPLFNKWVQAGRKAIAGDPDVISFSNSVSTFTSEYGKVMGGGYGSAEPSIHAQEKAEKLINDALTIEDLNAVFDTLRKEMKFRTDSLVMEESVIQDELKNPGQIFQSPDVTPPSSGSETPELTEEQYNSAPSGTKYRVPGNPTVMVKP